MSENNRAEALEPIRGEALGIDEFSGILNHFDGITDVRMDEARWPSIKLIVCRLGFESLRDARDLTIVHIHGEWLTTVFGQGFERGPVIISVRVRSPPAGPKRGQGVLPPPPGEGGPAVPTHPPTRSSTLKRSLVRWGL